MFTHHAYYFRGKITYYTVPPEVHTMPTHLSATIVNKMGEEFNVDALLSEVQDDCKGIINAIIRKYIANRNIMNIIFHGKYIVIHLFAMFSSGTFEMCNNS